MVKSLKKKIESKDKKLEIAENALFQHLSRKYGIKTEEKAIKTCNSEWTMQ